jgi:hypothetical protein
MIKTAFEVLDKTLEAKLAEMQTGEKVEIKATTTEEFAKSVAKDQFKGLMQVAEFRMLIYVIPVALILLIIALILGK